MIIQLVIGEQFGDTAVVYCAERAVCQGGIITQYSHVPRVVHIDTDV